MEDFKASFIRLSSLLGFADSRIANDLKNIELLINTDESSIQPIELKSQMMKMLQLDDSEPLDYSMPASNPIVSHSSKLNSTQLLNSPKSNAEQPSSPAIVVDLSAESVARQNSQSTGHLPRSAFSHSIEAILGTKASRNREAKTNKQMARKNRHVLDQYEKHEKSPRSNSAVVSNTTGASGAVLIPDRSQIQIHQGMNKTATHCLNLQLRNPAAAVSNTPSQKVGVTLPVLPNSSAIRMSTSLPFPWPCYTAVHLHLPKPTSFFAPHLASTYAWPPFSINPAVVYNEATAATQQATNGKAVFKSQAFCPSSATHKTVSPFCSGLPESQVQRSSIAVLPYFSSTCFYHSAHSNESRSKSLQNTSSLRFYKGTTKSMYDYKATDKNKKLREALVALTSGEICIDEKCRCAKKNDVEMLLHLHEEHGLIFNSATIMNKEEIMQGIKPSGTRPAKLQEVPYGMRLCRFNKGECFIAYPSKVHLCAHVVEKHRELVEHLRPASNTHYCEVCWAICGSKCNLEKHRLLYGHFIDDASKRSQMMKEGKGGKHTD